jgi:predicted nucleic acid-binding protein
LCKEIDEKDVPFVALTIELDCELWTFDKPITKGLTALVFTKFFEF